MDSEKDKKQDLAKSPETFRPFFQRQKNEPAKKEPPQQTPEVREPVEDQEGIRERNPESSDELQHN